MSSRPFREAPEILARVRRRLPLAAEEALRLLRDDAVDEARKNLSGRVLNPRSRNLLRSVRGRVRPASGGSGAHLDLSAGDERAPYARIHELGGRIVGNPWLVFQVAPGQWRKVREVTIPRRPYLRPALEDAQRRLPQHVASVLVPLLSFEGV